MKIQGDTIFLHPWDMEIIVQYGGLKGFLDAEKSHRDQTAMPFLPSVLQAVDVLCSENEEQVSYLRHNLRLRLLYELSKSSAFCYRTAVISKRDKTSRILHIPEYNLMRIQKRILSEILSYAKLPACATAYQAGANPRAGTAPHVGKPVLLKMDISNFFDSITFQMVLSRAFPSQYFPKPVGVLLAKLCCYCSRLPQGAPTSPALSNIVMAPFDEYMFSYCKKRGIAYTRYCDDMSFSGNFKPGPLIEKVRRFLNAMGFAVNEKKTKVLRQGQRQTVTGIVVNQKQQTPASYRRQIRQEMYYCKKYGVRSHIIRTGQAEYIADSSKSRDGKRVFQRRFVQHLLGKISYALYINPEDTKLHAYREDCMRWLDRS
jgi:retron-type reverse transcriptase